MFSGLRFMVRVLLVWNFGMTCALFVIAGLIRNLRVPRSLQFSVVVAKNVIDDADHQKEKSSSVMTWSPFFWGLLVNAAMTCVGGHTLVGFPFDSGLGISHNLHWYSEGFEPISKMLAFQYYPSSSIFIPGYRFGLT
ncbi:MAG: hypothetical protein Q8908_10180 [Bacteroidota bacterium]|nr:hypothetical protein [Bacteroidota bacterium]